MSAANSSPVQLRAPDRQRDHGRARRRQERSEAFVEKSGEARGVVRGDIADEEEHRGNVDDAPELGHRGVQRHRARPEQADEQRQRGRAPGPRARGQQEPDEDEAEVRKRVRRLLDPAPGAAPRRKKRVVARSRIGRPAQPPAAQAARSARHSALINRIAAKARRGKSSLELTAESRRSWRTARRRAKTPLGRWTPRPARRADRRPSPLFEDSPRRSPRVPRDYTPTPGPTGEP